MSGKLNTMTALLLEKALDTYEQEVGWIPRRVWTFRRGKKSFFLVRIRN